MQQCRDCLNFKASTSPAHGSCRAHPPVPLLLGHMPGGASTLSRPVPVTQSFWAEVPADGWCAEWRGEFTATFKPGHIPPPIALLTEAPVLSIPDDADAN